LFSVLSECGQNWSKIFLARKKYLSRFKFDKKTQGRVGVTDNTRRLATATDSARRLARATDSALGMARATDSAREPPIAHEGWREPPIAHESRQECSVHNTPEEFENVALFYFFRLTSLTNASPTRSFTKTLFKSEEF